MFTRLSLVAVFAMGCRAGFPSEEPASVAKAVPQAVSVPGAWNLFDRSVSSGFSPGAAPIDVRFERAATLSALKVFGEAPYRLVVRSGGADAGILATLDLSHLGTGWHSVETETLVTTDRVTLAFTPTGATTAQVPELGQLAEATTADKLDGLAPTTRVFAAGTKSDAIAPGNCASFAVDVDTSPTLYRRARLTYSTTGVVRAFVLERTINGLAPQGGRWLAGDTGQRETSEEIDPAVLIPGGNEVRLCVPQAATENVVISDLRIVGDIDLGVALAIKAQIDSDAAVAGDAAALVDRDPSSTVSIAAGERVVLSLDRLIAPDAVTISDGSVSTVECRREASTVRLRATPRTSDRGTRLVLDGQGHSCSELALTFSTDADVAEIDVSGSGTGDRVDWPRIVVTSASEHFGTTAWVGGFVAKPSRMRSAIRVELPGQSAQPSTGDFGRLLTRTGDAQDSWPVAVTARLPDGTAQTQQVVLGRDGRALAANASTSHGRRAGAATWSQVRVARQWLDHY